MGKLQLLLIWLLLITIINKTHTHTLTPTHNFVDKHKSGAHAFQYPTLIFHGKPAF